MIEFVLKRADEPYSSFNVKLTQGAKPDIMRERKFISLRRESLFFVFAFPIRSDMPKKCYFSIC